MSTETELITLVKKDASSDALVELADLHSGIYFSIVHKYSHTYPNIIKIDDMKDDKLFNIYQFVIDYKDDKNMKLSSYIGERTDYLCKSILRKEKNNPCTGASAAFGGFANDGSDNTFTTNPMCMVEQGSYTVAPTTTVVTLPKSTNVQQNKDIDEIKAALAAKGVCVNGKFLRILELRHFTEGNRMMSWRSIGKKMRLSHEWVRMIYNADIGYVKEYLKDKI